MAFTKISLTGMVDTIKAAFTKVNTLITDLLSTSAGKGASQIGIQDSAEYFTAVTVEAALAEEHAANVSAVALSDIFNENPSTITGLTWGYTAGTLRLNESIVSVEAGTIGLTDDATNYVQLKNDGTMTKNTTGFTSGYLPIRQIVCADEAQGTSTDKRCFFPLYAVPLPVDEGGTGQTSYTNGQLLIGNTTGNTLAKATLTGTANQITITNSTGSITISIPSAAVVTFANEGVHILDSDASHDLILKAGSDLTADRKLTLTTGDAARTITLSGNPTLADWFDQAVKAASIPQFAGVNVGHASDSTITRLGAGLLAIEGKTIMIGDGGTTKAWFYLNVAPTGWTIDATPADALLAVKGGSQAYNANGGTQAGTWTQPNHTHTGPSHTHTGPSHTHSTTIAAGGWAAVASILSGYLGMGRGTYSWGEVGHTNDRAFTSGAGGTGATGPSGTGNTGNPSAVTTYRPLANLGIICTLN